MTSFASFVELFKLRPEREPVGKMKLMFSSWPTKSSSPIITKNSRLSMLGKSCAMTKSGVSCLRLKLREALKRVRVWTFLTLKCLLIVGSVVVLTLCPTAGERVKVSREAIGSGRITD